MDNLIKDTATLELFCWLDPGTELPGWDILNGLPYVPRAIDRAAFDARSVPGVVELPLTTDYAW